MNTIPSTNLPTVVLVHGALTGSEVWSEVIKGLQHQDYAVISPALPLRGLASDVTYLDAFLKTIEGPIVLVGHSYGGSIISMTTNPNVKALVYIAAFQPDERETTGELNGRFPGSLLGPDTTIVRSYPGGNDLYLSLAAFRDVYANDISPEITAVMAVSQRPIDPAALEEQLVGVAAWRTIPSWTMITTNDYSLPTAAQQFMAERAGSATVTVHASHAAPVSHPADVIELVLRAARSIR